MRSEIHCNTDIHIRDGVYVAPPDSFVLLGIGIRRPSDTPQSTILEKLVEPYHESQD